MEIGVEQVRHLAHLARLALSEAELARVSEQISEILEYAGVIQAVNTDAISPTAQVIAHAGVLRDDVIEPSLSREAVLANAPASREGFFVVQAVLEQS